MTTTVPTGKIWQFPAKNPQKNDPTTLCDIIEAANDGDCIYLTPGVHLVTEPLKVTKNLFLIGFDDADDTPVELIFDGQLLLPVVPMLRADAPHVVFSRITCTFKHNDAEASPNRAAESFAIMVASGECELQSCAIRSSVSGVTVKKGAKCVLTDCDLQAVDVGLSSLGESFVKTCSFHDSAVGCDASDVDCHLHVDKSTVMRCSVGVKARGPTNVSDCTVSDCTVGFAAQLEDSNKVDAILVASTDFNDCERGAYVTGEGVFRKCRFERCRTAGVTIEVGAPRIQGCTITHCAIGAEILGGGASFDACLVLQCRDVGCLVSGPQTMPSIVQCVFTAITTHGNMASPVAASFMAATRLAVGEDDAHALPIDAAIAIAVEEGAAPHIEACSFTDNDVNIWFLSACGVVSTCILSNAIFDSILIAGAGGEVAVSNNQIEGSSRGAGLSIMAQAKASVKKNLIALCRLSAICLRGAGFSEVTSNELKDCQDAIVVMGTSYGEATRNVTELRIVVFNDAVGTFNART